jgi:hypothetical protein
LNLSILRLRLRLQHHALTHFLGDQMNLQRLLRHCLLPAPCFSLSPGASNSLELALKIIDARLELGDVLVTR